MDLNKFSNVAAELYWFLPFTSSYIMLIAAELYYRSFYSYLCRQQLRCTSAPQILHPINISKPAEREKESPGQLLGIESRASCLAASDRVNKSLLCLDTLCISLLTVFLGCLTLHGFSGTTVFVYKQYQCHTNQIVHVSVVDVSQTEQSSLL